MVILVLKGSISSAGKKTKERVIVKAREGSLCLDTSCLVIATFSDFNSDFVTIVIVG